MKCHWNPNANNPTTQCQNEATHVLDDSGLWYCVAHFDAVLGNRAWLKEYAALREKQASAAPGQNLALGSPGKGRGGSQ